MGKNGYLQKRENDRKHFLKAGLELGRQQIIDMMCITLNDPDVMGKDTFGKDRLLKVVKAIGEYIDVFQKAWEKDDESDYYRSKMDDMLSKIYGEELHDSFSKRYQYCYDFDYVKGKWK